MENKEICHVCKKPKNEKGSKYCSYPHKGRIENKEAKLKPCPFCGNEPKMDDFSGLHPDNTRIGISCVNQKCNIVTALEPSQGQAIQLWNTRKSISVERLEEIIKPVCRDCINDNVPWATISEKIKQAIEGDKWLNTRKPISVERLTDLIYSGVKFEILNDVTPYSIKEACEHIAEKIKQAIEEE